MIAVVVEEERGCVVEGEGEEERWLACRASLLSWIFLRDSARNGAGEEGEEGD